MFNIEDMYNQSIGMMRNIFEDIRFGRQLYLNSVASIADEICKTKADEVEILTLINNTKDANSYMYAHPVSVALISYVIGKWLNFDESRLKNLVCASFLHDIGKAKIKDSILNKKEALTLDEFEKLKAHPVIGYRLISSVNLFNIQVLQGVLFHHERTDGSGYPLGLKGEKINIYSRIIAIADTFDAITSGKGYHKKDSPLKALEEIKANSHRLDENICRIFIHKLINYYNGRSIRLNNEQFGNIIKINPEAITKPLICCENGYYDLLVEKELEIVEIY